MYLKKKKKIQKAIKSRILVLRFLSRDSNFALIRRALKYDIMPPDTCRPRILGR